MHEESTTRTAHPEHLEFVSLSDRRKAWRLHGAAIDRDRFPLDVGPGKWCEIENRGPDDLLVLDAEGGGPTVEPGDVIAIRERVDLTSSGDEGHCHVLFNDHADADHAA